MVIRIQMTETAQRITQQVLAIKPKEKVCILSDTEQSQAIVETLAMAVRHAGGEPVVVTMLPTGMGGVEPPEIAAAAISASDAAILLVSNALTHTKAIRNALKKGGRICNLREVNEEMMTHGGVTADYLKIKKTTEKLKILLDDTKIGRLTTEEGTDVTVSLQGRKATALAGFATQPGEFSGLPDGEAAIAPLEGSAEGKIVNPYLVEKIGLIRESFSLEIREGEVKDLKGGSEAIQLHELIIKTGKEAKNIGEFAIGTNPECRILSASRELKKRLGTAHIAVGDNLTLGGIVDCPLHLDLIFLRPTIELDGKVIVNKGKLTVSF